MLSAWPITGPGKSQLAFQKAKLAMAIRGKQLHYRTGEITAGHWHELAQKSGVPGLWQRMQSLLEASVPAMDRLGEQLPSRFPERVYSTIRAGILSRSQRLARTML